MLFISICVHFIPVCLQILFVCVDRGLFIVDGSNLLRHVCVHDNGVGRSVDETLRVINAIQYTDKFGEGVCIVCLVEVCKLCVW